MNTDLRVTPTGIRPWFEPPRFWSNPSLEDPLTICALVVRNPRMKDIARTMLAYGHELFPCIRSGYRFAQCRRRCFHHGGGGDLLPGRWGSPTVWRSIRCHPPSAFRRCVAMQPAASIVDAGRNAWGRRAGREPIRSSSRCGTRSASAHLRLGQAARGDHPFNDLPSPHALIVGEAVIDR